MKIPVEQFAHDVVACGLLTADDIESFRATAGKPGADATELAKKLVTAGKLTKYQAANALQGKAKNLVFGEYVVLAAIGAGGMGQVFKAEHRRMKRVVALKILPPATVKSASVVQRFQREVQAAARLEHPNIVTAHDAGEAHGVHFLVMQYVDGRDLSSLVAERGPLPPSKAVNYIVQAARGLAYAHGKGVIHRDVKPANLLLNQEGTIKILDLGLARLDDSLTPGPPGMATMTAFGDVMGTADYMAPEQAEDAHLADARADIYSLGCTLYFLLTGEALYRGTTLVQKMMAHREQPIPSLSRKRPDVPPALDQVFARMVAKRPADRLQTMHEVMTALAPLEAAAPGAISPAWTETVSALLDARLSPTLPFSPQAKAAPTVASDAAVAAGKPTLLHPDVVRKTWSATAKVTGALFGTIIAPILVTFIIKYIDKPDDPVDPSSAKENLTARSELGQKNESADPAPPPKSLLGQPVDLLALCDVKRDAIHGEWMIKSGVLETPMFDPDTNEMGTFRLPVVPVSEYDLIFSMSRATGGLDPPRGLGLILLVDDRYRGIVFMDGAAKQGRFWGLEMIDGKYRMDNGTGEKDKRLLDTNTSRVVVKVRRGGVSVTCDGESIFDWRGSAEQLKLDRGWSAFASSRDLVLVTRDLWKIYQLTFVPGGGDWQPLFNERDLTGWTGADMSPWKVDSARGELVGTRDSGPQWIYTKRDYRNFRLRLEFQMASGTNSGIALRGAPTDDEKDNLQIELCYEVPYNFPVPAGMVHNAAPGKHKSLNPVSPGGFRPHGEWNELEVEMHGHRLRVWVNGVRLQEADLKKAGASKDAVPALKRSAGRIGLQIATGEVRFRNIVLHESQD